MKRARSRTGESKRGVGGQLYWLVALVMSFDHVERTSSSHDRDRRDLENELRLRDELGARRFFLEREVAQTARREQETEED